MTDLCYQAGAVAIGGRALMITGASGLGKSSLALALIDRGAMLIGDDSLVLQAVDGALLAMPHLNTRGLLEVRNLGLVPMPVCQSAPVALIIRLDAQSPRYREQPDREVLCGISIPVLPLWPHSPVLALRAEMALHHYGLPDHRIIDG